MGKLEKILDFISKYVFEMLGVIGLAVMLIVAFGNVLSRYVLPVSWAFTEELTCGLFILVSMLGAAVAVTDRLPQNAQKYILIIQGIFSGFFGYLLFDYGTEMVKSEIKLNMKTAALQWPEAIFGSFIPIGGIALIIGSVCLVLQGLNQFVQKKEGKN